MVTLTVYLGVGALLVWTLVRRPQWIVVTLAAAFMGAIAVSELARGEALRSILLGMDGFVVLAMWALYSAYRSELAALVATAGLIKIIFGIGAAMQGWPLLVWVTGNNAIFIVQVLIAGGFLDGIIAWVGHRRLRSVSRGRRLLGHLEKVR